MVRSKYGMLEILRSAFFKSDAILLLRSLNRKFFQMADDPYLETFEEAKDSLVQEIRTTEDLTAFRSMVDYANLVRANSCLQIDFFWNFERFRTAQEEHQEAQMLVNLLLAPRGYKKLTVGADGLSSAYLPYAFVEVLVREIGRREIAIGELCLDLQYIQSPKTDSSSAA